VTDHVCAAEHGEAAPERGRGGAVGLAQIEIVLRHGFERTRGERGGGVLRRPADMAGKHEDRHRLDAHDLLDRLEAVHSRQLDVHGDDVGPESRQGLDRVLRGRAHADDGEAAVVLEHAPEPRSVGS
jgi:hypothetical protein